MEKKERERERAGYYCLQLITSDLIPGLFSSLLLLCDFLDSVLTSPHQVLENPSPGKERE